MAAVMKAGLRRNAATGVANGFAANDLMGSCCVIKGQIGYLIDPSDNVLRVRNSPIPTSFPAEKRCRIASKFAAFPRHAPDTLEVNVMLQEQKVASRRPADLVDPFDAVGVPMITLS
jgi:hypothetical protein